MSQIVQAFRDIEQESNLQLRMEEPDALVDIPEKQCSGQLMLRSQEVSPLKLPADLSFWFFSVLHEGFGLGG